MFGSENVQIVTLTIDADPVGDGNAFYLLRAPRALTVVGARMAAEQTQNAGTAVTLELQNWGTAGTAVKDGGTIVAALGGTAAAARLTAHVPANGVVTAAQAYIAEGEWLVVNYGEQGTGWIADDRFMYQVEFIYGK